MSYLLFAGDYYEPMGGINDLVGVFKTLDAAMAARKPGQEWAHIFDTETLIALKNCDDGVWTDEGIKFDEQ